MKKWGLFLALSAQGAVACGDDRAPANVAAWFKMNHETFEVATNSGSRTRYSVEIAPNQDLHAIVTTTEKGKTSSSEMMLISGNLLSKGEPLREGYEIDSMDAVALTLQLINQLLAAGTQKSPDEIKGTATLDHDEAKRTICVGTMSASGEYSPPWTVKGEATLKAPRDIAFRFAFSSAELGKESLSVTGEWRREATDVLFADDMNIKDWRFYRIGPIRKAKGSATILDYGASADLRKFITLGELRKATTEPLPADKPQ